MKPIDRLSEKCCSRNIESIDFSIWDFCPSKFDRMTESGIPWPSAHQGASFLLFDKLPASQQRHSCSEFSSSFPKKSKFQLSQIAFFNDQKYTLVWWVRKKLHKTLFVHTPGPSKGIFKVVVLRNTWTILKMLNSFTYFWKNERSRRAQDRS